PTASLFNNDPFPQQKQPATSPKARMMLLKVKWKTRTTLQSLAALNLARWVYSNRAVLPLVHVLSILSRSTELEAHCGGISTASMSWSSQTLPMVIARLCLVPTLEISRVSNRVPAQVWASTISRQLRLTSSSNQL